MHTIVLERAFCYPDLYHVATFPGIRTFFSGGHYAVAVFVISGYWLSMESMRLIHAREYGKLGDKIATALFRRWLRLYVPVICTTFVYMTSWHVFGLRIKILDRRRIDVTSFCLVCGAYEFHLRF